MRSLEIKLNYTNNLANDYLCNFTNLKQFFTYNPYDPQSFRQRYQYLLQKPPIDRATLVEVLRQYNLELGAGPKTLQNIELMASSDAVTVITGQQAGLLGGPLYTVYKALTAVQLAAKLTAELGAPVVPVFWIASEDHDFGEVNHLHLLDRQGEPVRLRLDFEPGGKYSIGEIPLPSEIDHLLDELVQNTSDSEFKPELIEFLRSSRRESENLADWFARIMVKLVGSTGLIFVNPMDSRLRSLEKELFKQAVENYPQVNGLLGEAALELKNAGYPAAIEKEADNLNLFMYHAKERLALVQEEEGIRPRGHSKLYTTQEILAGIEMNPEQFSPNVILRPITQDLLFPTLIYVGGPGEISYFAQYKRIYELFNMEMPIIFPRANVTLVEGIVEKYLQKYKLGLEDVLYRSEEVHSQYLEAQDDVGIESIFDNLCEEISSAYQKVFQAIGNLDSSLQQLGVENRERVISQVDWLKAKTLQSHRKSNEVFIRQFRKVCNSLAPKGQLQERYLGLLYFSLKYGPEFFSSLLEVDLVKDQQHKLIFLKK